MDREVARYLRTGEHDHAFTGWPGNDFLSCITNGKQVMRDALVAEVRRLEAGQSSPSLPAGFDSTTFARRKVTPMVTGLFPAKEREIILALLEKSLVFLTHDNIEEVLREEPYLSSARDLANLYLGSIGSRCLDGKPSYIVGLSQEATCYVSTDYFEEKDPFADFVVHEAAHVFHNWKREAVAVRITRKDRAAALAKLDAGEALAASGCQAEACGMLALAMLSPLAHRAGRAAASDLGEAPDAHVQDLLAETRRLALGGPDSLHGGVVQP